MRRASSADQAPHKQVNYSNSFGSSALPMTFILGVPGFALAVVQQAEGDEQLGRIITLNLAITP